MASSWRSDCYHFWQLSSQAVKSAERLQRVSLECYLIHNPEYFLLDALNRGREREAVLDEMNDRIYRVFVALESEVAAGRIDSYGVSSNSFAKAPSDSEYLPYDDLMALATHAAQQAGNARHHLTTLELPINLLETEGLRCANWAKSHGLRVLANRPLNAQYGDQMYRLADYPPSETYETHLNELLLLCSNGALGSLSNLVMQLDEVKHRFGWIGEYESFLYGEVVPHIRNALASLEENERAEVAQRIALFLDAYGRAVAHECSRNVRQALREKLEGCAEALQLCALDFLLAQPDIDVVLLGMQRPRYVAEISEHFSL